MEGQQAPLDQSSGNRLQRSLPNATAVLVLGIIAIPTFCCYGVVGLTLGIIALILAGKDLKRYKEDPDLYTPGSYSNLKAGRVCAIIGLCLSALYIIYIVIVLAFYGTVLFNMKDILQQMQ